jgi:hypothetical protein
MEVLSLNRVRSCRPAFPGPLLNRVIRWPFVLFAIFSLMGIAGCATACPLTYHASVAWGPILMALSVSYRFSFIEVSPNIGRNQCPCVGETFCMILPGQVNSHPLGSEKWINPT